MESLFSKITGEITAFCNTIENFVTFIGIFLRVAFLEISVSSLIIKTAGLQSTSCNPTTKEELLSKFLKDVLDILEKFSEDFFNGAPS